MDCSHKLKQRKMHLFKVLGVALTKLFCLQVDAIEFYTEEENRLGGEVENEKVKALQRPTGVAFLTFDSIENANKVLRDHRNKCDCFRNIPTSSVSSDLKPYNWFIRVAPSPEDIYW